MQCLILAGGFGTRMEHVSNGLPKPLIPVLGKPFIDYQLGWLAGQGITRVILSVGYKAHMIVEYLATCNHQGLDIDCIEDGEIPLGTAGAIRNAVDHCALKGGFFVLYGDSWLKVDFHDIWRVSQSGTKPVMTVFKNDGQWDSCNVLMKDDKLALFQKNASPGIKAEMKYIDYGLSVLSRDLVLEVVPPLAPCDLADVQHRLSREGRLLAYEVFDRFYEIGSPQGLRDLETHLKGKYDD